MRTGFTLIELLACMAIMGIIGTASIPAFNRWQSQQTYRNNVDKVLLAFQSAKQNAIGTYQDYWVSWLDGCIAISPDELASCETTQGQLLDDAITLNGNFASGNQVRFSQGRGMAGFNSGSLRIRHQFFDTHETRLIVSALGRIRLCQSRALFSEIEEC